MKDERNIIHPIVNTRTLQGQLGWYHMARKDDGKGTHINMKTTKRDK